MNGQTLGLRKQRKRKNEAQPSFSEGNFLGSLERDWTRIRWDSQKPGILRICRKKLAGTGTTQGSMLVNIKNGDGYVPSAAYGSKKG